MLSPSRISLLRIGERLSTETQKLFFKQRVLC